MAGHGPPPDPEVNGTRRLPVFALVSGRVFCAVFALYPVKRLMYPQ
jgi:hypothetical protein